MRNLLQLSGMLQVWAKVHYMLDEGTYSVIVRLFLHQLWCHVQRSSFDGGQHHCVAGHGTSKAEIAQLDNSICSNQNILRLHVAMDDAVGVEVMQCTHKLLCDALYCGFWQTLIILQYLKQFT